MSSFALLDKLMGKATNPAPTPAAQTPPQNPNDPNGQVIQNQNLGMNPGMENNPVQYNNGQPPLINGNTPPNSGSTLDEFSKLWDTVPQDPNAAPQSLTPNPEQLNKIVAGMDFTKGIDPALAQKALQGDTNALVEIINTSSRQVFSQALQASTQLSERSTKREVENFGKGLDGKLRSFSAQDKLLAQNPKFNHPAVKPYLKNLEAQMSRQYPEASAEEIATKARKYMVEMSKLMADDNTNTPDDDDDSFAQTGILPKKKADDDWSGYFGGVG